MIHLKSFCIVFIKCYLYEKQVLLKNKISLAI